ncbi:MAG: CoA transferase subunit A [Bacteroidetes bacterium]|nr:CoA transferase subunit A [Bacteroidota bacterium]
MDIAAKGKGPVFTDPNPDNARAFFRNKNRKMVRKLMSLKAAVSQFVQDGDYLVIGGFGANRTPLAACHEIVRQGKKNLGFAGHTSTHDMQVLSSGEVFDRVDVAYIVGLEARGLSSCSRKYMQSGKVQICEDTNYGLALRLKAAAMGLSYMPARNVMGTDTFKYGCGIITKCPFTGIPLVLKPAIYPDIAFLHVHEADVYGNCRFKGISAADIDTANAAKKLVITAERLITNDEIRNNPDVVQIPYYLVDAVCEVPGGAYPGNMPGEYFSDEEHLREWLQAEKDPEKFSAFLKKNIYDCTCHQDYINVNGGAEKMRQLRQQELMVGEDT